MPDFKFYPVDGGTCLNEDKFNSFVRWVIEVDGALKKHEANAKIINGD